MNYQEYLKLDILLSAQQPKSEAVGRPAHDELLFISVHHTYEVWFKQVLHELDSVLQFFSQPKIAEKDMGTIVARLERINKIFKVLVSQVDVLETMTPMDFLEFRDLIYSASGFRALPTTASLITPHFLKSKLPPCKKPKVRLASFHALKLG